MRASIPARATYLSGTVMPLIRTTLRRLRLDFGDELFHKNDEQVIDSANYQGDDDNGPVEMGAVIWRDRLDELDQHHEDQQDAEDKRRVCELYLSGDFGKGEYNRRRAVLQAELGALVDPEPSAIETAGETLETLGEAWADAPKRLQAKMLKTILEEVRVDVAAR
jgi:hypothetical protein